MRMDEALAFVEELASSDETFDGLVGVTYAGGLDVAIHVEAIIVTDADGSTFVITKRNVNETLARLGWVAAPVVNL